jgi:hypothetical protein
MKKSSVNFKDLTGVVFQKLTVLSRDTEIGKKPIKWKCFCECGKETLVSSGDLLSGHTASCGCIKGGYTVSSIKLDSKPCSYCGTHFTPERRSDKYCSIDCKTNYNKNVKYPSQSKECQRNKMAEWRMNNQAKKILSNIKTRNNIDIDLEWIQSRLDAGVCEVTGIKFTAPIYGQNAKGFNHFPWIPSIDKVDPNGGYCKSNCKMVVWAYNRAKGLWTDEDMVILAKGILDGTNK